MPTTIAGFGATQLPHWCYKLKRNFLLQSDITRAQAARKHLESFIGRAGASWFFDVSLQTWILPSSLLYAILPLQPLLQSLQHQRRLMLRKTLPLRSLRLLL
jgi:hypothetical protein